MTAKYDTGSQIIYNADLLTGNNDYKSLQNHAALALGGIALDKQAAGVGVNTGKGADVIDQSTFGAQTQMPLPFDDNYSKVADLIAIKNSLPPGMFDQQEHMFDTLQDMMPQLAASFKYETSIFDGVPDNVTLNRMNIYRQRDRENRMYAFV